LPFSALVRPGDIFVFRETSWTPAEHQQPNGLALLVGSFGAVLLGPIPPLYQELAADVDTEVNTRGSALLSFNSSDPRASADGGNRGSTTAQESRG